MHPIAYKIAAQAQENACKDYDVNSKDLGDPVAQLTKAMRDSKDDYKPHWMYGEKKKWDDRNDMEWGAPTTIYGGDAGDRLFGANRGATYGGV